VAISVNYELRSVERLTEIYLMNHRLRRLGIQPRPPGQSALTDGVKFSAGKAISRLRALLRPNRAERRVAVWSPPLAH
jgi:hypothetical protein